MPTTENQPRLYIKSFFAASVMEAMERARVELGPDALLMNTREAPPEARHLGECEVVFGVRPPAPRPSSAITAADPGARPSCFVFPARGPSEPNAKPTRTPTGALPEVPAAAALRAAAGGDAAADPEVRVAAVRLRAVVRPLGWASIAEGATL